MRLSNAFGAVTLLGIALVSGVAHASVPAGVWIKVSSVDPDPNTNPTEIRVHGAVMLYDGSTTGPYSGYTKPANGYLYYKCPADKQATCVSEWKDLAANAAAKRTVCVGFGDYTLPTGTLRAPGTTPSSPDTYPIQLGVAKGAVLPCRVLAEYLDSLETGGTGGTSGAGGATNGGTGGVTAGTGGVATGGSPGSGGNGGTAVIATGGAPSTSGGSGNATGGTGSTSKGGNSSSTGGRSSTGGSSTGNAGSAGATDEDSDDDSGCSVAAAPRASSLLGLGIAAFAAAALGRRRIRRVK